MPSRAIMRRALSASRGSRPPGSGDPVPGTNPASIESMSKDRKTALAFFHAASSAISTALSTPISSTSEIVITVVSRSRATLTPGRDPYQPPIPIWTRLVGGAFSMFVAWNHGVVCIRSSMSRSWRSRWRSRWMIPTRPSTWGAMPRTYRSRGSHTLGVEDQLLVRLQVRDADADEAQGPGAVFEGAVEEPAGQGADLLRVGEARRQR